MPSYEQKRTDFLWIVQMFMLRDQEQVMGFHGDAGDAVAASYRIPARMTARDAAREFWASKCHDFRGGGPAEVPSWLANLDDPSYG